MNKEQETKAKALEMAIKSSRELDSNSDIIERAKEFEIYLMS